MIDDIETTTNSESEVTIPREDAMATEQKVESSEERNFRVMREKNERLQRERDEALNYIRAMQTQQKPAQEEDYGISLGNDDLAEGKHLKGVAKEVKSVKKELEYYKQQAAEQRLRAECPDLDKVLTDENIKELARRKPALAQSLNNNPDMYEKGKTAWELIKALGIYQDDTFKEERDRAQANAAKPRPLTSVSPQQGDSPLSRANAFTNGLTPDLQKELLKEMNQYRKNF